jgi:hypothetical protein
MIGHRVAEMQCLLITQSDSTHDYSGMHDGAKSTQETAGLSVFDAGDVPAAWRGCWCCKQQIGDGNRHGHNAHDDSRQYIGI